MEGSWKVRGGFTEAADDLADGPDEGEDEADVVRERLPRAAEELGHVLRLRPRTHAAHTISSAPMGICR